MSASKSTAADKKPSKFNVFLAQPRGFCAGVDRAVLMVERALEIFDTPIYIRHEIVHNRHVVDELKKKGAIFVEEVTDIPEEAVIIFSAHGVSQQVKAEAKAKNLKVFDATCPLVTKVHLEVHRFSKDKMECILIGHSGHPEVEGTLGQYDEGQGGKIYLVEDLAQARAVEVENAEALAYVTQTTLSLDDTKEIIQELKRRFPKIREPYKDDICYATQNRQNAVLDLARQCDLVLVIGSKNSSNSTRLSELAEKRGCTSYLVDDERDLRAEWFVSVKNVGVTAGASAPEILVVRMIERLKQLGASKIMELDGKKEKVVFNLPANMRRLSSAGAGSGSGDESMEKIIASSVS